MSRMLHLSISIGWLLDESAWPDSKLGGALTKNGEKMSANEIREYLREKFERGERQMLMAGEGGVCEGFDPVTGCPGHDEEG